jgi:3-deoxy-D-manno-octulosonate 8-phosphate phosphatase KdsC-like HAD superfamily phosphatase
MAPEVFSRARSSRTRRPGALRSLIVPGVGLLGALTRETVPPLVPQWRAVRCAHPRCRGAGEGGEGRHARRRQDRYPLAEGRRKVVHIEPVAGFTADQVLQRRPSGERASEQDDDAPGLHALRAAGVRVVMLTGDGKPTAEAIGRELGIDEVVAEVLAEGKAGVVKQLQAEDRFVAMAGDGVNDAPALAQATVGVAMGTGTDAAIGSAGITLLKGDLMGIARARTLSHATMRNIRQNLFLSFACNVAGIPLAAGVLYPFLGVLLSPVVAAAAMAPFSVSVIGNALRLRAARIE